MNTLITPAQAVASAFTDGEYLAPEAIGEGDIAAAEQRYIVPVIGRAFHEKLLAGLQFLPILFLIATLHRTNQDIFWRMLHIDKL